MDITPAPVAEDRDEHVADLRAALQRVIPLLGYSAGLEAATDPGHSELLLTTADHLTNLSARTAP
ncbi:hypothetical protein GCM10027168_70900 [Streptomyces capparidis]